MMTAVAVPFRASINATWERGRVIIVSQPWTLFDASDPSRGTRLVVAVS